MVLPVPVSEPTPYAKYRISQYGQQAGPTHQSEYEDVKVRPSLPSLQTRITFGEGLKSPSELFGSLKRAGQRFIGADHIVVSDKIPHKFTGKSSNGKCQCRHHQKKLIEKSSETETHEIYPIAEQIVNVEGDTTCSQSDLVKVKYIKGFKTTYYVTL